MVECSAPLKAVMKGSQWAAKSAALTADSMAYLWAEYWVPRLVASLGLLLVALKV